MSDLARLQVSLKSIEVFALLQSKFRLNCSPVVPIMLLDSVGKVRLSQSKIL